MKNDDKIKKRFNPITKILLLRQITFSRIENISKKLENYTNFFQLCKEISPKINPQILSYVLLGNKWYNYNVHFKRLGRYLSDFNMTILLIIE